MLCSRVSGTKRASGLSIGTIPSGTTFDPTLDTTLDTTLDAGPAVLPPTGGVWTTGAGDVVEDGAGRRNGAGRRDGMG
jgi:hypothetical protein